MKKSIKNLSIGALAAMFALMVAVMAPVKSVSAQTPVAPQGGFGVNNPIASWIVLDGLFGPGGGYGAGGGIGANNPIASWIVLDGLFGPR